MMYSASQESDSAIATTAGHADHRDASSVNRSIVPPTAAPRADKWLGRLPVIPVGVLSLADQAIVSATSFASAAILGRLTSKDQLGLYYFTLSIVFLVVGFQDQLIAAPYLVYAKRRHGRDHAEYAGSMWFHHLALSAVTVLVLFMAIAAVSALGNLTTILPSAATILHSLWVLVPVIALLLLREDIRRFSFADLHLHSALAIDVTVAVIQVGGLLLLGYFGRLTLWSIFGVMGGSCALASLGWFLFDRPDVRFVSERFGADWRHNWAFSKWALRSHLLGSSTPYFMIWIVTFAIGAAAAGVLGACATLIGIIRVIQGGVTNVLTPQCSHAFVTGGCRDLRRVLLRASLILGLTLGPVCLALLVTGDTLVVLVFGESFQGCGTILFTLSLAALFGALGVVVGNGLWAIDRARDNFIADVLSTLVTLIAAVFLVVPLGPLGAALAILAGTAAATAVRCGILVRTWRCTTCKIIPR